MVRKDKHIRVHESIISVMDDYANKTLRTKTVAYEIALLEFIKSHKAEIIDLGISPDELNKAINSHQI